jgi:hypothetical protein
LILKAQKMKPADLPAGSGFYDYALSSYSSPPPTRMPNDDGGGDGR